MAILVWSFPAVGSENDRENERASRCIGDYDYKSMSSSSLRSVTSGFSYMNQQERKETYNVILIWILIFLLTRQGGIV